MFEAKLQEGALLKKIVESVKDIVTEVNFDTTATGISMQAMDASHVALVSLNMGIDLFSNYRSDTPMQLGISITTLSKVMKLASLDDSITLQATEDPTSLSLRFESKNAMKNVNFSVNLLNIDGQHLGIPDTEYAATITMSASQFSKNIHDLYSLAETVVIEASSGKVKMSIEGDMGQGEIEFVQNEQTHIVADAPVKLSFSLRYLNMFTKAASLSNEVTLGLLPDTPLVISYDLQEAGALKFYLAPKIND